MAGKYWKQFMPFYFFAGVSAAWLAAAAYSQPLAIGKIALLVTAGLLSWGFVEYVLHRFIFHYQARTARMHSIIYAMHLSHHDNPKALDQLFASLRMSAPIAACYCLLAWLLVGSWQEVGYLFTGLIVGYFCYELLHYQAHHGSPRWRPFQYLKKYHMLHHYYSSQSRFGVTSPFVDMMFGTYQPVNLRRREPIIDRES
ncbi:MAG: sterol desaturase family protein [Acidobacteriota bacterium]